MDCNWLQGEVFQGLDMDKIASGVTCDGEETSLDQCFHHALGGDVVCPEKQMVAGVICTTSKYKKYFNIISSFLWSRD